jgi:hypothetical protein
LDRGTIDNFAYVPNPSELASPVEIEEMLQWYDVVVHLASLSTGRPDLYRQSTTNHRNEDLEAARIVDKRLSHLWSRHNRYHYIDCYETFEERMKEVSRVLRASGAPIS